MVHVNIPFINHSKGNLQYKIPCNTTTPTHKPEASRKSEGEFSLARTEHSEL